MRKTISQIKAIVNNGKVILSWYQCTPFFKTQTREFDNFRIFRKTTDFVFGEDYEEYFLNLPPDDATLIFEGPLPAGNDRKYVFEDAEVEFRHTYAYFVQTQSSPRIGPIPVRVRDPEVWWPYATLLSRLTALCEKSNGLARSGVCGQTAHGRDIPWLEVGHGSATLGLVGLIHGGESGPELIIPAIANLLESAPDIFQQVRIVAIPAVNIDAREALAQGTPWYIRTNLQGVDLNRNFPAFWETIEYGYGLDSSDPDSITYRGPAAASAPETRAVLHVFQNHPPDVLLSYHSLAGICGLPAISSRYGDEKYARQCLEILRRFSPGFFPEREFSAEWLVPVCSAGSLPTWLFKTGGIPAFDLECGVNPVALEQCRHDQTDRILLAEYQLRHTRALKTVLQMMVGG